MNAMKEAEQIDNFQSSCKNNFLNNLARKDFHYITDYNSYYTNIRNFTEKHPIFDSIEIVQLNNKWLDDICIIDEKCQLILNNNVSRRSSINQGKCFLRAAKEAFFTKSNISTPTNQEKIQVLSKVLQTKTDINIYGHYPIIFGLVCGLLNISEVLTKKIFFR
jgi:hypothetical protein